MYVKRMKIEAYRGLKSLDVSFDGPNEIGNVVNVLVGKNGSGKTTVLDLISSWFTAHERSVEYGQMDVIDGPEIPMFEDISQGKKTRSFASNLGNEVRTLTNGDIPPFKFPQFIYLPAMLQFGEANSKKPLKLEYSLSATISDNLLGRTADYIKEFVIANERLQNEADATIRAEKAVEAFNKPSLFTNVDGETFGIDGLSDGEKQIYGRLVGLMMLQPKNSVILIDEPEIAIHPAWQYLILGIYKSIGSGNQFIVATHSAQILSSVPWQSIQVISREKESTRCDRLPGPPTGIDSASILSEVMGADFYHPELHELKKQYRELFDKKKESTPKGIELKEKLENLESRDSEFFQELRMIEKIRERKNEDNS